MNKTVKNADGSTKVVPSTYVLQPGETFGADTTDAIGTTKTAAQNNSSSNASGADRPAHTYVVTLVGNGDLYGWKELDEKGERVNSSVQSYASAADAEKAIRSLAPSFDIVEVLAVSNVNTEANRNVNLVKPDLLEDNFGMNPVRRSIETLIPSTQAPTVQPEHDNVEKMIEVDAARAPLIAQAEADKAQSDLRAQQAQQVEADRVAAEDKRRASLTPDQRAVEDKATSDKAAADAQKAADANAEATRQEAIRVAQDKVDAAKAQLDAANARESTVTPAPTPTPTPTPTPVTPTPVTA